MAMAMAMYVIVKALLHPSRLNDARNCTKISIAKNAQVGSRERNICKDVIHESAATKVVCQQNIHTSRVAMMRHASTRGAVYS